MNKLYKLLNCVYKAAQNLIIHDGVEHAGYMAFLTMLSLFPFLVFLTAFAGFLGQSNIGHEFVQVVLSNLPANIVESLKPRINEIISGPPEGLLTISIIGVIWTASSSVEGLRTILNRVYRVSTPPAYILRRLLSIAQFLVLIALVTVSMIGLVFFPIIWNNLASNFNYIASMTEIIQQPSWVYTRYAIIGLVMFFVVATLYFILPNIKLGFKAVLPGAAIVVILWLASGYGLSLYINNFNQVNLIYGSLGGIIISLLFFYMVNLIFIYGAELNYLLKHYFPSRSRKRI